MHRSDEAMIWIGNLKKKRSSISVAKAKHFVILPLPYVLESHARLNGNFFMTLYSVDSNEAIK
jgi:hypothetical protein